VGTIYSPPGADRTDPYLSPTYGNGAHVRAASGPRMTGQATRLDPAQISRLPVSVLRPIWARINLFGLHNAEVPPPAVSPPAPSGTATHGPGCLDCVQG
jgi:hypothetical protein